MGEKNKCFSLTCYPVIGQKSGDSNEIRMGAKFSKGGKLKQPNGTEGHEGDESLDTFDKTSTLPASFRKKDEEVTKAGTLPRGGVDLNRSTSFSKRFRKSMTKLVGKNDVIEQPINECETPTKNVLGTEEGKENKDVSEDKTDFKAAETPKREIDIKTAQKRARAAFFQDLYNPKEPVHIPKPPRSRNLESPSEKVDHEADITVTTAALGTPVGKLIKKHEGEIEKQLNRSNSFNSEKKENELETKNNADSALSENEKLDLSVKDKSIMKENESLANEKTSLLEEKVITESLEKEIKKEEHVVYENKEQSEVIHMASETGASEADNNSVQVVSMVSKTEEVEHFSSVSSSKVIETHEGNDETEVKVHTRVAVEDDMTNTMTIIQSNETMTSVNQEIEESHLQEEVSIPHSPEEKSKEKTEESLPTCSSVVEEDDKEGEIEKVSDDLQVNDTAADSEETGTEDEPKQKDIEEHAMTKDNGDHAIISHEEEEIKIDQSKPSDAVQAIKDDNVTEPNSLESIDQNDEINQASNETREPEKMPEEEGVLVKEKTQDNTAAAVAVDSRSDAGSEGGISTDEGIVASDDEDNKKPELQKESALETTTIKSSDKSCEELEDEKES